MQATVKKLFFLSLALLTGCATELGSKLKDEQSLFQQRAQQAQTIVRQQQADQPYVLHESKPKFTTRSIPYERIEPLPAHLGKITMKVPGRHTLAAIGEMIERLIEIPVSMSPDALIDSSQFAPGPVVVPNPTPLGSEALITNETTKRASVNAGSNTITLNDQELRTTYELNYTGNVTGLLDSIATRAGLQWQYQSGRIVFTRVVTRAITVKSMTGSISANGSGGGGSSSASNDIWSVLDPTLRTMLSSRGRMVLDSRLGLVTVTDALQNVNAIARFIDQINESMLRQVALDVEVLQIDLSQEFATGIDWSVVSNGLGAAGSLTANGTAMLKAYSGSAAGQIQSVIGRSDGGNVKSLLSILEQFGRVTTAYSTVVVTTNRQPVPLGVQNSESYLASITSGTANAVTGMSTGSSLSPASVSTGFSMMLMPLIMDSNRILIESSFQVSALREMKSFGTKTGSTTTGSSGTFETNIQLPSVDSYSTMQRVSVAAGDTIVISGFEREVVMRDSADVVRDVLPGSRRGKTTKQSTVILITPRLQ